MPVPGETRTGETRTRLLAKGRGRPVRGCWRKDSWGERPVRTDVVAAPARSTAADLLGNEVTVHRASSSNALEAHTKEVSREPCCHRSRRQGIADLHPSTRWDHCRGVQGPHEEARRARRDLDDEPDRDGDLCGSGLAPVRWTVDGAAQAGRAGGR